MSTPLKRFAHLACPTYYAVQLKDCAASDLTCFDPELWDPNLPRPKDGGWPSSEKIATELADKLNDGRLDHDDFYWHTALEYKQCYVPPDVYGLKVFPKPDL